MRNALWFVMLIMGLAAVVPAHAQGSASEAAPVQAAKDTGCCGPVTDAGKSMLQMLDSMDVEHRWLPDRHVHWESGRAEGGIITDGKPHTHCSAFAAAVGERLNIYMLRPPQHSQLFLASAQGVWFTGEKAANKGWVRVVSAREAQMRANHGELVILDYINPEAGRHGHIAIVRPAVKSEAALAVEGPETMQAGQTNFADGNAVRSFHSHPGAWPTQVLMYAHATRLSSAEKHEVFVEDATPGEESTQP